MSNPSDVGGKWVEVVERYAECFTCGRKFPQSKVQPITIRPVVLPAHYWRSTRCPGSFREVEA